MQDSKTRPRTTDSHTKRRTHGTVSSRTSGRHTTPRTKSPTRRSTKYSVWFKDGMAYGNDDLGGKGLNLSKLVSAGLPVPEGYVITAAAYFQFLRANKLTEPISYLVDTCNVHNEAELFAVEKKIKDLFMSAPMPLSVRKDILAAHAELCSEDLQLRLAVRSSATAEDQEGDAFAGAQDTYTNVMGPDEVVDRVRECWASLFNSRAIFYRAERGYDHMSTGLAVVIQVMINGILSGTGFTCDPNSFDDDKIFFEIVYGQGEAVVSGEQTPFKYTYSQALDRIIEFKAGNQQKMLVLNPRSKKRNRNVWRDVSPEMAAKNPLSNEMALQVAYLLDSVQNLYGVPMDCEFVIEADSLGNPKHIKLVQARPETTSSMGASIDFSGELPDEPCLRIPLADGDLGCSGVGTGRVFIVDKFEDLKNGFETGMVLVAFMTDPDMLPYMKRAAAIITDAGGRTSHAAITCRENGITGVIGTGNGREQLRKYAGQVVTVSALGDQYEVFLGEAKTRLSLGAKRMEYIKADLERVRHLTHRTSVGITMASPERVAEIAGAPFKYNGLGRMEFFWGEIGIHPQEIIRTGRTKEIIKLLAKQIIAWAKPLGDRKAVLRLQDLKPEEMRDGLEGGEKYEPSPEDERNSMMGFRGVTRYLERPEEIAIELKAIRMARRKCKNIVVMVPFARTPEESIAAAHMCRDYGMVNGVDGFELWLMGEIPSLIVEDCMKLFIFDEDGTQLYSAISIGSNDLTQFLFAKDRDNKYVKHVADERHIVAIKAMQYIVREGHRLGLYISICGQAPSDFPEVADALIDAGIDGIAVAADTVAQMKRRCAFREGLLANREAWASRAMQMDRAIERRLARAKAAAEQANETGKVIKVNFKRAA